MQDSLEDYIRIVNNTKQNIVGNLNSEDKVISWEKKQQYENYAFKIIEFMIDGKLQPQVFVKSLNFINQDHYQDIIEERAVTKICGYPICGKRLPPMPKKQFHISTKQNKIYDITDRKHFCCNYCYQASDFIKKQIDTSPLWSRRPEDFPRFILLDQNEINQQSLFSLRPGIEIDHGLAKLPTDNNFTSVNSFTEACLDEAEEMEYIRLMKEKEEDEKGSQLKPKSILKKKKNMVNKDRIEEEDDENQGNFKESKNDRDLLIERKRGNKENVSSKDLKESNRLVNSNSSNVVKKKIIDDDKIEIQKTITNVSGDEGGVKITTDDLKQSNVKLSLDGEENIQELDKKCKNEDPLEIKEFEEKSTELFNCVNVEESADLIEKFTDKCTIEERNLDKLKTLEFEVEETTAQKVTASSILEKNNYGDITTSQIEEVIPTQFCDVKGEGILIQEKYRVKGRPLENKEITLRELNFEDSKASGEQQEEKLEIKENSEVELKSLILSCEAEYQKTFLQQRVEVKYDESQKGSDENKIPKVSNEVVKKVTVEKYYSEPSTSGRKTVRFKTDSPQLTKSIPPLKENNSNIPEEEIAEFKEYIDGICKSMGIIPKSPKPIEKPVEFNEAKMRLVIEKVNASEVSRNKRVQLIETNKNPEINKMLTKSVNEVPKYAHRIAEKVKNESDENLKRVIEKVKSKHSPPPVEMPKYAHRIVEKVKTPEEDKNLKIVIEKVKNLKINRHKEDDKLKEVLQKIKRKEEKPKGSVLINTSINPESQEVPKKKEIIIPKPVEVSPALEKIRTTLLQWLTLESYIFIHGEARIKRILNEETLEDYFENLKVAELETAKQVKYMNICKKLQLREMAEEKFDGVLLNTYKQRKPLPDYSRLKEESKDMDLKVKAFFMGNVYEKDDPNFKSKKGGGSEEDDNLAVLPLVDAGSQNAVRKKIFINAVSKYVQIHIKELELEEEILIEVQNMIKTFKFEADNIIFKPQLWNIIGYVLIVMLSCKCEVVKSKLTAEPADTYRNLIFSKYCDGNGFLRQVLHIVESVELYVKNYITSD